MRLPQKYLLSMSSLAVSPAGEARNQRGIVSPRSLTCVDRHRRDGHTTPGFDSRRCVASVLAFALAWEAAPPLGRDDLSSSKTVRDCRRPHLRARCSRQLSIETRRDHRSKNISFTNRPIAKQQDPCPRWSENDVVIFQAQFTHLSGTVVMVARNTTKRPGAIKRSHRA
jgi:hypothetical protein